MRCNHCRSQMLPTDQQGDGRSQQTSYLCPLCGATAVSFRLLGEREATRCRPSDPAYRGANRLPPAAGWGRGTEGQRRGP